MTNPRLPCVYVAGPYRGKSRAAVELNIQVARKVGMLAAIKGWSPVIPHSNTAHLDEAERRGIPVFYSDSELPPVAVWHVANDNRARG